MNRGNRCPLCEGAQELQLWSKRHSLFRCPACGLVFFVGPVPFDLYEKDYFSGSEYVNYEADAPVRRKNFAQRLSDIRRHVTGGKLLELGCAFGDFLEVAAPFFDVHGIDRSRFAVEKAQKNGRPAHHGDFLQLPDPPTPYHAVCLWDTIEHLEDPFSVIQKAARWLAPGGWLFLTTGNIESAVARYRGDRWRLVHPPSHLFYFSEKTLDRLIRRAGLEKIEARSVGFFRGLRSMVGETLRRSFPSLENRISPWIWDLPIYLNLYDVLFFAARKPSSDGGGVGQKICNTSNVP